MADIDNVRTLEDLIAVVRRLYFNLNQINNQYYNMFINPEPMTLQFERYNDVGVLETVDLKNRAAELTQTLSGYGSPDGVQLANPGILYIDLSTKYLWYKSQGTDEFGWVCLYSVNNIPNYLTPTSAAPDLKDLNASNVSSGILSAAYGGTGVAGGLYGIPKANGANAFVQAVADEDYISASALIGMIAYFPKQLSASKTNWLLCNGTTFSATEYPALYAFLGTTTLPDLADRFIRSWDGSSTSGDKAIGGKAGDSLKAHSHTLGGSGSTNEAGNHYHDVNNAKVSTSTKRGDAQPSGSEAGDFVGSLSQGGTLYTNTVGNHTHTVPSTGFTISSTGETETAPKHIVLVPMIYAGLKKVS